MISQRDIIHFSLNDYWIRVEGQARYSLINQFLKNNNRVFWINSFGMRMPSFKKKGNIKKFYNKAKSYLKLIRKVRDGFWVYSPIAAPLFGSKKLKKVNDYFLLLQIKFVVKVFNVKNPILFVTSPMFPHVINNIDKDIVIYYYSDKYTSYREITHREKINQLDDMTLSLADYTFCCSKEILKEVSIKNNNVFYLPHAVDFNYFNGFLSKETILPEDMKGIKKPIIGYFGSLTDSNDLDLIKYLANNRPNYSFVLIGQPSIEYNELKCIANIYLLGKKDYKEIPLYGKYFDVCFMAWKMTEWIKQCSPVKTMEYLALGKPVVAIPIDELVNEYKDVVEIANGKEDFLKKIDESLENDSQEKRMLRSEFVRNETWENRFMKMVDVIKK